MDAARLLRNCRQAAHLTQRQLAARAGTSAAAVCLYEQGSRIPRTDTLARLLAAAGVTLELTATGRSAVDISVNARALVDVLDLAGALPQRHAPTIEYPVLRDLAP